MGVFYYHDRTFEFEDRLLTHVQTVVGLKLRRSECFYLSWLPGRSTGAGRHAVWITNGVAMRFEFSGSRTPALNRDWVERMVVSANSGHGLNLSDVLNREPATP
jgi:hypothetical protein